jgi:hypothetical protein
MGKHKKKIRTQDHPFFGMRKDDKRSVEQVMKELRRPRYYYDPPKKTVMRAGGGA